jgi:hypothetical protein
MGIIIEILGIMWCILCVGMIMCTIIEYITIKNKKL